MFNNNIEDKANNGKHDRRVLSRHPYEMNNTSQTDVAPWCHKWIGYGWIGWYLGGVLINVNIYEDKYDNDDVDEKLERGFLSPDANIHLPQDWWDLTPAADLKPNTISEI